MTKAEHCDCHVVAENDLQGAIYWLLRCYRDGFDSRVSGLHHGLMLEWFFNHGYDPASPKARRLLARKQVPR